jgi:hypothetical protein
MSIYNVTMVTVYIITETSETSDEMQKLEEKARQLAEEAMKDKNKPDKGIMFVR